MNYPTQNGLRSKLQQLSSRLRNADKYDRQDIEEQMRYVRAQLARLQLEESCAVR